MINKDLSQERKKQIQDLSKQIEELSAQLALLITQDQEQELNEQQGLTATNEEQSFAIGDRVIITNNYKGHRGKQGIITHITDKQVSLRVDGQQRVINKRKTNIRKV
jgi:hypothetical protein